MERAEKRILIVAGEASADRYGARLVDRLRSRHGRDAIRFYGAGGDEMLQAGVELECHVRELAHIGVREALTSLRTYMRTYRRIVRRAETEPPDVAVLLDFPEFNLRLAKKMKRQGTRVIYYISPQVWAWRSGRVRTIREFVDKMLVILPFEEEYYRKRGVTVEFVGHPLLEDFEPRRDREQFLRGLDLDPRRATIAILGGSRRKEIDYILPTLLRASQQILEKLPAQFLISAAPTVDRGHIGAVVDGVLGRDPGARFFRVVSQNSRDILASSDFAFVKSGTSSLEAALVGTPFLVTYKISPLSWLIGSLLIRIPMKGLVNLVAGEKIVPELFQGEANPQQLSRTALEYLQSPDKRRAMSLRLAGIRDQLGRRTASEAVAAAVGCYL